ncbi:MAG: redoxin domain-containing protein [Bacteroidetes bacterium]|nr:redoxin domain-containing protein [Bacteroidota bacterium]
MNCRLLLFVLFTAGFLANPAKAQRMEFRIPQMPDTTIYLARYYGSELYYCDTARLENGVVVFNGDKHPVGLFAVVLPGTRYFEVIHENEPVVMTVSDTSDHIGSISVQESQNNKVFFEYVACLGDYVQKTNALNEKYKAAAGNPKKEAAITKKIRAQTKKLNAIRKKLAVENDSLFVSQFIRLTMDVDLPEAPRDKKGVITDSNYVYNYYISHYWDGIDLKNPGIVYTPVFHNRLSAYFSNNGLVQIPDTIIKYSVLLLEQMDQKDRTNYVFQYSLGYIAQKYQNVPVMNMDRILWYLGRNYYCPPNTKAWWVTPENLVQVCDRVNRIDKVLIGNSAIPLILTDSTETNWISLYDIQADYTVVYFWDPNCSHCIEETPKLQTLYDQKLKSRNIAVYAVAHATGSDFEDWKRYIRDNNLTFINVGLTKTIYNQAMKDPAPLMQYTTPQSLDYPNEYDVYSTPKIFILDKDKKILYKQLSVAQVEQVLDELTGHAADEKLFPVE